MQNYMVLSNYSYPMINCLHIIIWLQVISSNYMVANNYSLWTVMASINLMQIICIVMWIQVFLYNTNKFQTDLLDLLDGT